MTIAELLRSATQANASSDSAALDAALLLAHVLNVDLSYFKTWPDCTLSDQIRNTSTACCSGDLRVNPLPLLLAAKGSGALI